MGLFDRFKKNQKEQEHNNTHIPSVQTPPNIAQESFEAAMRLINSNDHDTYLKGRRMMISLASSRQVHDHRVNLWMAKEYEKGHAYSSAAGWYKKAYNAGYKSAKADYERCYNPYHIDDPVSISGERGCGTPHLMYVSKMEDKQNKDFADAVKKLNDNPTEAEAKSAVQTIILIANSYNCACDDSFVWMGHFCEEIQEDYVSAATWFRKAAENDHAEGARCYADMLMIGRGVSANVQEAIKYYSIAAEKGHPEAQFVLGEYYKTQGNIVASLKYYNLAAKNGYEPARIRITQLERRGTASNSPLQYQNALRNKLMDIVEEHNFSGNGVVELYAGIYQPIDFCRQAYEYCQKQYGQYGEDRVRSEYIMTSFYGAICTVALWQKYPNSYDNNSAWDVLFQQIDVEFTDANAEALLGTKQGEEKAEQIYSIICELIKPAKAIMADHKDEKEVCLFAMQQAYMLGMLIAKREISSEKKR